MLIPRDADNNEQPVIAGQVEEPEGWNGIGANRVQTGGSHRAKIGDYNLARGKGDPFVVGTKCPVRGAAQVDRLGTESE